MYGATALWEFESSLEQTRPKLIINIITQLFDSRATHARTLQPVACVPFGFVLFQVQVRVRTISLVR